MSPESGADDQTLTRLYNNHQEQQHRLDAAGGLMTSSSSSPWQLGSVVKRELPSNAVMMAVGVDENRSSVDSWTYVSPGAVTTATYFPRRPTTGTPSSLLHIKHTG